MTEYLTHITRENERWDSIAYYYYNDISLMGRLIEENRHAPIAPWLPSGIVLKIPVIERESNSVGQPPWK